MKTLFAIVVFIGLAFESSNLVGQIYDDPNKVDDDYVYQGEYFGELDTAAGLMKIGMQVIALGEGNFKGVGYHGGLPGDGWDGEAPSRSKGSLESGQVTFENDHIVAVLADEKIEFRLSDGTELGAIEKIERTSPTLGKEPPEGAVVLFDGETTDNFVSTKKGQPARMTDDGLLMQGANSNHLFNDCQLHIEFRLPYQPTASGQQRGNSGVYLQGRYEVQMLDSFGLAGEHNECGGIYSIRKPDENMCFPPLTWQTYDIDFVAAKFNDSGEKVSNARLTVKHNGVVIHDDVELPNTTTAAPLKESAEKGYLHLQDHGNPVRYRNIWLVETEEE